MRVHLCEKLTQYAAFIVIQITRGKSVMIGIVNEYTLQIVSYCYYPANCAPRIECVYLIENIMTPFVLP